MLGATALSSPVAASLALLALFGLWWGLARPEKRALVPVLVAVLLAVVWGLVGAWSQRQEATGDLARIEADYQEMVKALRREADNVALEVEQWSRGQDPPGPDAPTPTRLAAFRELERQQRLLAPTSTLLWVDEGGEVWVWAGQGLRHDLPSPLPTGPEIGAVSSFTAVTFLAAAPLGSTGTAQTLVIGRSFPTDRMTFSGRPGRLERRRWSVRLDPADPPRDARSSAVHRIRVDRAPTLEVLLTDPAAPPPGTRARRWPLAFVSLGMILLAATRLTHDGLLALGENSSSLAASFWSASTGVVGSCALVWALGVDWRAVGFLGVAMTLLVLGVLVPTRLAAGPPVWLATGATVAAVTSGLWVVWHQLAESEVVDPAFGVLGLGHSLFGSPLAMTLRIATWASLAGALSFLSSGRSTQSARRLGLVGPVLVVAVLTVAAALLGRPVLAFLAALLAALLLAEWWSRGPRSTARQLVLLLVCAPLAASLWEATHRQALESWVETRTIDQFANEDPAAVSQLDDQILSWFAGFDLEQLAVGDPDRVTERQDVALAIWQASPLPYRDALSAVVVLPSDGAPIAFRWGLEIDARTMDLNEASLPAWTMSFLEGSTDLFAEGEIWGEIRWWVVPRPGPGRAERARALPQTGLLRGEASLDRLGGRLGPDLSVSYLDPFGRLVASTLATSADPAEGVGRDRLGRPGDRLVTREIGANGQDGLLVLRLAGIGALAGIERVATHVVSTLFVAALGILAMVVVVAVPLPAFRSALRLEMSRYSNRLVMAFLAVLVVPLVLLGALLILSLRDNASRAREAAGAAALESARTILNDYLTELEPGLSIDSALDTPLLDWISVVASHDVNLYWQGQLHRSSEPDLFTAGLLPRRIPGEVFADLALAGRPLAVREHREPDARYLELYGPALLPEERPEDARLFLSVPLLTLQDETAAALQVQTRRLVVVTTLLMLGLFAVASRLSRGFARPLTEIVAGTRRIAAGAVSLELDPREPELQALVEAIDEMADRIALGRRSLEREKQVLEGVVENITAAVVSLGSGEQVIMRNRAAKALLSVEVGQTLEDVAAAEHLAPLALSLAERRRDRPLRTTVRLASDEAEQGTDGEKEWSLVWLPVEGAGDPAALLVVEDVSEVLRAERLEAWAEMARLIAHEIKNPLTPIRLATEHLQRVWRRSPEQLDSVFERCTENILEQVEELRRTATEFSTYSRIPEAERLHADLALVVRSVVEPYVTSRPPGVEIAMAGVDQQIPAAIDQRLIGRALRNLVENALRASGASGRVDITLSARHGLASLTVADRGRGVPVGQLERIFDPWFSTSSGGTGLGLPITRRVAEAHDGRVYARHREGGGLEVVLELPTEPPIEGANDAPSAPPGDAG